MAKGLGRESAGSWGGRILATVSEKKGVAPPLTWCPERGRGPSDLKRRKSVHALPLLNCQRRADRSRMPPRATRKKAWEESV